LHGGEKHNAIADKYTIGVGVANACWHIIKWYSIEKLLGINCIEPYDIGDNAVFNDCLIHCKHSLTMTANNNNSAATGMVLSTAAT